jgi:predicted DNA-binding transcriptional regulator AlpA
MTPAKQRIAAYRARQKAKGMKEIAVHLAPEALEALRLLLDTNPDASMGEVISSALVATAAKLKPKVPTPALTPLAMPLMLSTTETARRLAVTVPELVRWRKEGRGPKAHRVKDSWRYDERDIDAWTQEGQQIAEQFQAILKPERPEIAR